MNPINYAAKYAAFAILVAVILIAAVSPIYAIKGKTNLPKTTSQTKLWQQIEKSAVPLQLFSQPSVLPEKYLTFRLDQANLQNALAQLPLENTRTARKVVMEIPMPDGTIQRFRMEETQVLADHLARDFPDWKTFIGYGVDDPTARGRFDWNALGFHGYVATRKGIVMIDPFQRGDTENYMVFYKHEFGKSPDEFYCRIEQRMTKFVESEFKPSALAFTFGNTVRTYRLALATTGEWARNAAGFNGSQTPQQIRTAALAVITTTVNRLNGIYERELASKFLLSNPSITDEAKNIIFDNPDTDPYNNTDQAEDNPGLGRIDQLRVNQETLDARVLTANYDIGHLYGTGGGGVASSPSLCSTAKAQGYSARGTNTGDPFVVDYVSHEIGHQFGASHTYNNADPDGACTTRSATSAFEVGSGATIMSYVGICNQRNLQQYVDTGFPSFHIKSLTEIINNITTGDPSTNNCGTTSGANAVPTVNAGNSFTIPKLTPFTLAATGSDADPSDAPNLLYSWEEYDLAPSPSGALGTPANTYDVDNDGVLRPLFRPYSPVPSSQRTFPSLAFILNPQNNDATADVGGVRGNQPQLTYTGTHPTGFPGAVCEANMTCVTGERLPTINRTMQFRVSLRDRRGGIVDSGTSVTVAAGGGPFQVTSQNSATTWLANSTQTVTWDVANTNVAPINVSTVNIRLSTDGGQTFATTLAANVPNNGTQQITVPSISTTQARIKVEAVGNIFFDISNADFTVSTATPTQAGQLIISEFRLRGPGGANDEFIELYNTTNSALTATPADNSAGLAVAASDGVARCVVPSGTVIPAGGHYLCVNSGGYSLSNYPAGNGATATGDRTYTTDIPDNAGLAIFNNATGGSSFSVANRLDAVGSTAETNAIYKEGTGYPILTTNSLEYSLYRKYLFQIGVSPPSDTGGNATDFIYVDTLGTASVGAGQRLGAPAPENLSSPIARNNVFPASYLDPAVAGSGPPNLVRDSTPDSANNSNLGTLEIRRTLTNNTGVPVTRLRFRVIDITTMSSPAGTADLRVRSSGDVMVNITGGAVTVRGTTLETPPAQANGGGYNSTLSVSLGTPIPAGSTINVRFLLGVQQAGRFRFFVNTEVLP
jgi:hypothetical protein